MSAHWLDSVLSAPSIGFQLAVPPSVTRRAAQEFGAFLDYLNREHDQLLIGEGSNASTPDGFSYRLALDASGYHAIVQFQHKALEDRAPGRLPELAFGMADKGATELIRIAQERLRQLLTLTRVLESATLRRIGLNVRVQLSEDQLPEGISRFRAALSSPWSSNDSGEVRKSTTNLLIRLKNSVTANHWDQCHHGLDYEIEAKIPEYVCLLDYQRVWSTNAPTVSAGLESLEKFIETALTYFHDFAFSESPWPPR